MTIRCLLAALFLGLLASGPPARADDQADLKALLQRLEQRDRENQHRLEKLEQQNRELQRRLDEVIAPANHDTAGAVTPAALEPSAKPPAATSAADKKEDKVKEYAVGENLGLTARWDTSVGLAGPNSFWVVESADKAFRVHVGGRTQLDAIVYNAGQAIQYGNNGVGRVDDSLDFRRGRLTVDGTLWDVFDFWAEYEFFNADTLAQFVTLNQTKQNGVVTDVAPVRVGRVLNAPGPTDLWAQFRNPYLNVRIGNLKPAISFEHNTSSRFLNFLERSYAFDAFVGGPDNGFSPGMLVYRNFCDDRIHFSSSLNKFNQTVYGFNTGDHELSLCVRAGGFPIYQDDGARALWLGCGVRHNDPDFLVTSNRQFVGQTDGQVRLRARTLLRNGNFELQTPLLDIFPFGSSQDLIVPELAFVCGPWTVQSEYYGSWLHDARALPNDPRGVTQFTQSAYVEVLYFLTGEHRVFNRQIPGFARVVPHENVWLQKCGNIGRGAWQIGARYSWIDLADHGVLGGNNTIGNAQSVTVGLNWFLNPNMKLQWNYTYEQRYNVNFVGPVNGVAPPTIGLLPNLPSNGELHGAGMRMAIDF